jgi:transcriptional regulator with GAF, ATPase, and Fis domain/serine/threonine protein kinase
VWQVKDRITGAELALKVLAEGAGESEVLALVREAMALSGLEGLGVPRIVAFGSLLGGARRFLVREVVLGQSLADLMTEEGTEWAHALAKASAQLTALHRAGFLHGDVKPANIIVAPDGAATLVDLGLAAPWREGGTLPVGLTPKYAAPELFEGAALTVRAEVYALGASLAEGLERRGQELPEATQRALDAIAARATQQLATARYPSVDEFESELRLAIGLPPTLFEREAAWPVLGVEFAAAELVASALALRPGEVLPVVGPAGSGRTTLVRRLAWTLGVRGSTVATFDEDHGAMTPREVLELQLGPEQGTVHAGPEGSAAPSRYLVIDDVERLDEGARAVVRRALADGVKAVAVGSPEWLRATWGETLRCAPAFDVPALDDESAAELLQRAVPSLPNALRAHLVAKSGGRPGTLRAWVREIGDRTLVSLDEVDEMLSRAAPLTPSSTREQALHKTEQLLDTGRFDEAASELRLVGAPRSKDESVRVAIARARVAWGRGDAPVALAHLDTVEREAKDGPLHRAWLVTRARACLRAGRYAEAATLATTVVEATGNDAMAADARAIRGLSFVYDGRDTLARDELDQAVSLARALGDRRVEAIALCSLAIAQQRGGRNDEARATYVLGLTAAEAARDASTVATIRLNLSTLAQLDGDLSGALSHLEAAVDMGRRSGALVAVHQALMSLANLDLYLGRYARAKASIESLSRSEEELGSVARADLLGLRADLVARTGDPSEAAALYVACAEARAAQGRVLDAMEAHLEGLLVRVKTPGATAAGLSHELDALKARVKDGGFLEHQALADLVEGTIATTWGSEGPARAAFDRALDSARRAGRKEWAWRTLDARARLLSTQGSMALARRDVDDALAILEEIAAKLPRDLREVFWDDPRRHALRQAHYATSPATPLQSARGAPRSAAVTLLGQSRSDDAKLGHILEVMRELATEHDLPRLLSKVTEHAVFLLGAERGFVVLQGDKGLSVHASRDATGDESHASFSRSVAETVVRTGEPVIATRARDDQRLAAAVSVHQLMIQSIACVPIRGAPPAGVPIGALYLETRLRPGSQFEAELPTLAAFADQAAIAIETARLLQENRARTDELARANHDLAAARDQLEKVLGRRTEQLSIVRKDLRAVRAELDGHFGYAGLVGTCAAMRKLYALIDRVRDTDVSLLVTGESGVGKEVVARAIHNAGVRAKKPFTGLNCGAIPANLLESELFGHVRGAFTGADRDRKGLFRETEGGTVLLDEIGELPAAMQAGLLRTLQEKTVRPVGGAREEPIDVRIIAATNRDLSQMVAAGTFREDLYYRLNVIQVQIPPLRERKDDLPALIDHFLSLFATRYRRDRKAVERAALRVLSAYEWPGNVRQLEHVLLNAWLMSDGDEITVDDLSLPAALPVRRAPAKPGGEDAPRETVPRSPEEFKDEEKRHILRALTACNWNRVQAAKQLGLPRRTFYRRLKEYGIL